MTQATRFLTREEILAQKSLPRETVHVPEWGGDVIIKGMTGAERDAFESSVIDKKGSRHPQVNTRNLRAKLVSRCAIYEDGSLLFPEEKDVEALGALSASALSRLYDVASRLAGISEEDIEDLAKNSGSDLSGVSS